MRGANSEFNDNFQQSSENALKFQKRFSKFKYVSEQRWHDLNLAHLFSIQKRQPNQKT